MRGVFVWPFLLLEVFAIPPEDVDDPAGCVDDAKVAPADADVVVVADADDVEGFVVCADGCCCLPLGVVAVAPAGTKDEEEEDKDEDEDEDEDNGRATAEDEDDDDEDEDEVDPVLGREERAGEEGAAFFKDVVSADKRKGRQEGRKERKMQTIEISMNNIVIIIVGQFGDLNPSIFIHGFILIEIGVLF